MNQFTPKRNPADAAVYDVSAVPALIKEVENLSNGFLTGPGEDTRIQLVNATRKLLLALETPRDTMMRHCYADPSTLLALSCVVETGSLAYLDEHDGPFKAADLGKAVGVDPALMSRLMRHLGAVGYLKELAPDTYERTHFTKALSIPAIGETYPVVTKCALPAYANFHTFAAKTNWKTPSDPFHGNYQDALKTEKNYLDYIQSQPDGYRFALHMQAYGMGRPRWFDSGFYPIQANLIDGFDRSEGSAFLVDVGGSIGHDLEDFLREHPHVPGSLVLQDLPMVLNNITQLNSRIEKMPHDFNNKQPVENARAYYLHSILHDWPDETCIKILSNIAQAMKPGYSKVLINDNVIPDTGAHWEATSTDIVMATMLSALERTRSHWEDLIARAGLKVIKIWYPRYVNGNSLIECERQ